MAAGKQVIDLSEDAKMAGVPDFVLKTMKKKWHSRLCQCCWRDESVVALCLDCVGNMGGEAESMSGSDTEEYDDPAHVAEVLGSQVVDTDDHVDITGQ